MYLKWIFYDKTFLLSTFYFLSKPLWANQIVTDLGYDVAFCDGCTYSEKVSKAKALVTSLQGKVVIADVINDEITGFTVHRESEPGFPGGIPLVFVSNFTLDRTMMSAFSDYMTVYLQLKNATGNWSSIPAKLTSGVGSFSATYNASAATRSYSVPENIAGSVAELYQEGSGIVKQRAVSTALSMAYLSSLASAATSAFKALVLKHRLKITVKFADGSAVEFQLAGGIAASAQFEMLPDTAVDASGKPIDLRAPPGTNIIALGGGVYKSSSSDIPNITCVTTWTGENGRYSSGLVCYFES